MADITYEAVVQRAERANGGKKMTDLEVILYLQGELERYRQEASELREKIKAVETITTVDAEFARFRNEVFKGLLGIYETFSENEQRAFDLGELHGRLKNIEEGIK